ncbi:MAG: ABC transporter substrate-binding protein [Oscillospiraceae bacterium]|nr:ABC transporter substrate-binding protein [Oscillospiraceae bacterium]
MKKALALLLVVVMALGLVACGGNKSNATVYKLGGVGPLTGGAAIYGNAVQNGAKIAVDEINALGGDIQFDLKFEDDAHDAEKSVNAYNALMDWGMQIFLGSVTSTPGAATAAESVNDGIFYLTPSASSTDVLGGVADPITGTVSIERRNNVFQLCFMDPNQGSASAQYIKDKALGEKIAIIYKNDDVYSVGIYNSFKAKADELNLNIVSTTTFTEGSKTDFSVQVDAAKAAGADLVFLPMYYESAALILKEANAKNYAPKFFGVDGMDGILSVENFDTKLAEGVMLLTPFSADATDAKTKAFVAEYQKRHGEVPNQFAADAYDCVYAIYEALKASPEAKPSMSAKELGDLLAKKFTSADFSFNGVTGEGMTWGTDGAVTKSPKGMVIQNGVYVGM